MKILFEDESIIVVDKPAGITVNNSFTIKNEQTIQHFLEQKLKKEILKYENTDFSKRAGIVHRLDKETSGILLVAKSPKVLENLQKQFQSRKVLKRYLALVHGIISPSFGEINVPIERLPWNRMHFGVFPGGKEAKTKYIVKEIYTNRINSSLKYSFLEVFPHTGRTHQIRVHLKYIGHPVVGDKLYAGRKTAKEDRKFCPRQFLHSDYLQINHPEKNRSIAFTSPLPLELCKVLSDLKKIS